MTTPIIRSHAGLRGIAALAVVMHHYRQNLTPALDLDKYTLAFDGAGAFVDLFFVLSGFILAANYNHWFANGIKASDATTFLRKRLARIYPLHLATLALMLLLLIVNGQRLPLTSDLLENFFLIHAWGMNEVYILNFPSWSISAEWMLYLLFPILAYLCSGTTSRVLLFTLAICAYFALFIFGDGLELDEPLSLWRAIPAFVIGMALFVHREKVDGLTPALRSGMQIVTFGLIAMLLHFGILSILLVPLFAVLVILTRGDKGVLSLGMGWSPFVWLGEISYSIYMLHVPVRAVMYLVFGKLALSTDDPNCAVAFVVSCLTVTICCGVLSYRWFESPARRLISGGNA